MENLLTYCSCLLCLINVLSVSPHLLIISFSALVNVKYQKFVASYFVIKTGKMNSSLNSIYIWPKR